MRIHHSKAFSVLNYLALHSFKDPKNPKRSWLVRSASLEPMLFFYRFTGLEFPWPPQPAACLNNAIPISSSILYSNSCLLVFPSPSLFRLCSILHGSKMTALLSKVSELLKYGAMLFVSMEFSGGPFKGRQGKFPAEKVT